LPTLRGTDATAEPVAVLLDDLHQAAAAAPLPPDFFSVFATVRAMAVVAVGDRVAAQALVIDLAPISGLLAGTASTALALQPVAQSLGEQVARLWGAPHWIARAQAARDRLG
jgi:hypothetical protein